MKPDKGYGMNKLFNLFNEVYSEETFCDGW